MNSSASDQLIPTKKTAKLQIIPFVAVVLLLLLAFAMYSQSLEKKSVITHDFGGCSCGGWGSQGDREPAVVLQVTDAGLFWNKELITQRELPVALAKYAAKCKNPQILLSSDDRAKYGTTIETLDEIRKACIKQVLVETVYRGTGQ